MDTNVKQIDDFGQFPYQIIKDEAINTSKKIDGISSCDFNVSTRMYSEKQKIHLVTEFYKSNLSISEFSNLNGLIPATFRNWAIKYNKEVKLALGEDESKCPTIHDIVETFSNESSNQQQNEKFEETKNSIKPIDVTDKLKSYLDHSNMHNNTEERKNISIKINGYVFEVDNIGLKSLMEVIKNV